MDLLVESLEDSHSAQYSLSPVTALRLQGLEHVRKAHGTQSRQFKQASLLFKQILEASFSSAYLRKDLVLFYLLETRPRLKPLLR